MNILFRVTKDLWGTFCVWYEVKAIQHPIKCGFLFTAIIYPASFGLSYLALLPFIGQP